jgi:hypothetical protein
MSSHLISKNVTLSIALYGYEMWALALREEHRLRVFGNRALRRMFGHKREDVTGCASFTIYTLHKILLG